MMYVAIVQKGIEIVGVYGPYADLSEAIEATLSGTTTVDMPDGSTMSYHEISK